MKPIKIIFSLLIVLSIFSFKQIPNPVIVGTSPKRSFEFYQIKTYLLSTVEQEKITDSFLEKAYLPALKKTGINSVGVFKLKKNSESERKIIIVIPFASWEQMVSLDEKLSKDKNYLSEGANYLNATYDQAPFIRIESVVLKSFSDHPFLVKPKITSSRLDRVYELRSYESATESIYNRKVDMFNAGGEIKLFDRLGFNAVFYGEVISGPKMPNLMYMTTFENQESRDAHWKSFVESPEWKLLLTLEKYKNTISHMDITFLYPTTYSDY